MNAKLKLFQKGLLLAAILLSFELTLLGTLAYLLNRAEIETTRARRIELIMIDSTLQIKAYYDLCSTLILLGMARNDALIERYNSVLQQFQERNQSLRRRLLLDGNSGKSLEFIEADSKKILTVMERVKVLIDARDFSDLTQIRNIAQGEFASSTNELINHLTDLTNRYKKIRSTYSPEDSNRPVKALLWTGFVLNIFVVIALIRSFTINISNRLAVLSENTLRLTRGEALHSQVAGSDEIAMVDSSFHQMSERLAEAARKEKAVVENMPVGFLLVDEVLTIKLVNSTFENITGIARDKLVGESLVSLLLPDKDKDDKALINHIIQKSSESVYDCRILREDGEERYMNFSLNRFVSSEGDILIGTMLDVTARHQLEQLRNDFVSIVSHDLRTPLTSIGACLHVLPFNRFGQMNDEGRRMVGVAQKEIDRLMRLIKSLLDVARMEAGNISLDIMDFPISSLITRSIAAVSSFAEGKGITIDYLSSDFQVVADEERLIQVLVNLLSNAIKFSNAGSAIKVTVFESEEHFEIRVTDTGRGIPRDMHEAIFERFKQVARADATEKGGTGLGLPICRMLLASHGGTIGVESTEGVGSTFWFRLQRDCSAKAVD